MIIIAVTIIIVVTIIIKYCHCYHLCLLNVKLPTNMLGSKNSPHYKTQELENKLCQLSAGSFKPPKKLKIEASRQTLGFTVPTVHLNESNHLHIHCTCMISQRQHLPLTYKINVLGLVSQENFPKNHECHLSFPSCELANSHSFPR